MELRDGGRNMLLSGFLRCWVTGGDYQLRLCSILPQVPQSCSGMGCKQRIPRRFQEVYALSVAGL